MLSVIVPTYNEAGNLPGLVRRLHGVLLDASIDYELIIADDDSPDDTVRVCGELAAEYPLRLIVAADRPRDLSLSVIDGLRAARHDLIVVMDADLSHPPETIPSMVRHVEENPDEMVVGSRYAAGGSFDRDWSLWRFANSHVATLLARPLVRCSDPMSGFFCFLKSRIVIDDLRPIGYKIGLEIMVRGDFRRIEDMPIAFADREIGHSKMNLEQQVRYLRHLRRLYLKKFGGFAEFIHFGVVGASGFIVDVSFYYFFQWLGIPHQVARGLSFWPAVSWNWALNRQVTFGERARRPRMRQWMEFVMASLVGFSINWGLYVLLTSNFAFFDEYRLIALITPIGVAAIFNFTLSSLFVYSNTRR